MKLTLDDGLYHEKNSHWNNGHISISDDSIEIDRWLEESMFYLIIYILWKRITICEAYFKNMRVAARRDVLNAYAIHTKYTQNIICGKCNVHPSTFTPAWFPFWTIFRYEFHFYYAWLLIESNTYNECQTIYMNTSYMFIYCTNNARCTLMATGVYFWQQISQLAGLHAAWLANKSWLSIFYIFLFTTNATYLRHCLTAFHLPFATSVWT